MRHAAIGLSLLLSISLHAASGTIREIPIRSQAIAQNLTGDPADQTFAVYLPPNYDASTARFPVLYLLHGIGGGYQDFTKHWNIAPMMDALIASGAPPFIVVMPNGRNALGGAFYANSPVVGNWETFIAEELVAKVDGELRTIAKPESRGIAGHSMGGYGAITIAMDHPDVFGSLYAMSPCCLDLTQDIGYGNPEWRKAIRFQSPADIGPSIQAGDFYPVAMIALSAVFSPNPQKPPFFVDFPVQYVRGELLPDEKVYESWRKQFPIEHIDEKRDNLLRLRAIALDYGTSDQFAHIPTATPDFSRELARQRIPHTLDVYRGDHRNQLQTRLADVVLPFFARTLQK